MNYNKNIKTPLFGAVAGDIIGSVFEWRNTKTTDFEMFTEGSDYTDDTVLSIAVADCLLNKGNYTKTLQEYGRKYPHRGYGGFFSGWLIKDVPKPYNSYGNGSAMRASACGCCFDTIEETLEEAKRSSEVTHNHIEGIKGAQATAAAIFMARKDKSKEEIREYITDRFKYNLNRTVKEIRPEYTFDESCQGTVPEAIIAFLDSNSYENAIRLAISLGGDSDTIACITGGIALAYYKNMPVEIGLKAWNKLPEEFQEIITSFDEIAQLKNNS
jgi:ADP-ribosylglycohydrolase